MLKITFVIFLLQVLSSFAERKYNTNHNMKYPQ